MNKQEYVKQTRQNRRKIETSKAIVRLAAIVNSRRLR